MDKKWQSGIADFLMLMNVQKTTFMKEQLQWETFVTAEATSAIMLP